VKSVDVLSEVEEPPDWLPDIQSVASRAAERMGVRSWNISVLLCDDERISELNAEYRHIRGATDVLTFSQNEGDHVPAAEEAQLSGDVIVSLESVASNAREFGVEPREECVRVVTHALLHLGGYEHEGTSLSDAEAREHPMFSLQEDIVREIMKEQEK
jgi:probable rRNA maturation factor